MLHAEGCDEELGKLVQYRLPASALIWLYVLYIQVTVQEEEEVQVIEEVGRIANWLYATPYIYCLLDFGSYIVYTLSGQFWNKVWP